MHYPGVWSTNVIGARNETAKSATVDTTRRDEELVALALEGQEEAFETLVLKYRGLVTRVARRFLPDLSDAEDQAQEAFVRAYKKLHTLRKGIPFRNWLVRVTINLCLDRLRRRKRRPVEPVSQVSQEGLAWIERRLHSESQQALKRQEQRWEAEELLEHVVSRLAPSEQAVLHLLYGEELDSSEVAKLLGKTAVNVRVTAFRARRTLKKALEELVNRQEERRYAT